MFSLKRNWSKYLNEAHCSVPNLFHVEWPKTEKAREPAVESLVQGIWRLRVSEAERRIGYIYTFTNTDRFDVS